MIVVIAILATVSVITYNGIQKRAGTIAYTATVDSLEKHFRIADTFGDLSKDLSTPEEAGEALGSVLAFTLLGALGVPIAVGHCVGNATDYPATADFDAGECYRIVDGDGVESSSVMIDQEFSDKLANAGMDLPRNLPVVTRTWGYQGQSVKIVSRGVYVIMLHNVAYVFWNPPDASSCGRGVNIGHEVEKAVQEAGGIEGMIATVKADPEQVAQLQETYGDDWEAEYRKVLEMFFGSDRSGSCVLMINR